MSGFDRKSHWNQIYSNKKLEEVSWYQPTPVTSLKYLNDLNISKDAHIIDIGGGDSFFADHLVEEGYQKITVLDISEFAIERARQRLGEAANSVDWIVSDAANFKPIHTYDYWHDRAAFHFLTSEEDIKSYVDTASHAISKGGYMVIGTFSESGPEKCSGIKIKQYNAQSLESLFSPQFEMIACQQVDHPTPFGTTQNFTFCSFKKL